MEQGNLSPRDLIPFIGSRASEVLSGKRAITVDFLKKVAQLSWSEEGPRLAKEFLGKHGIPLVIVQHLPKTYLDGAALRLSDGRPVIGLTLRYDRIDNFGSACYTSWLMSAGTWTTTRELLSSMT